ncbi:MAG: hypothetical protein JWN95_2526 [Frankiales bacterium]|nr:hypothetical protein [Frankiales bacterium]
MDSDLQAWELPAFELDCRDWIVATPEDGTVPDEIGGAPVVAVLSTVVIGAVHLEPATAVLSIGLLDEPADANGDCFSASTAATPAELIDVDFSDGSARYIVPAPDGKLALLVEFTGGGSQSGELIRRLEVLMTSFRWAG